MKTIQPNTLGMRFEVLSSLAEEIAYLGDVSFQMNADRGGMFVQVSNIDWPDGIERIVSGNRFADYLVIKRGRYSTIIHCAGDEIDV